MEILTLIILYYLAQNPDFTEKVKPIMGNLKNSEEALKFLNELSRFSELFTSPKSPSNGETHEEPHDVPHEADQTENKEGQKEKPQSPTSGFADAFIEECLEKYFKRN
jgi:hypothetical protein